MNIIKQAAAAVLVLGLAPAGIAWGQTPDDRPALHPLEAYCVDYRLTGIQTGDLTECIRAHGYERVEKRKVRIEMAGEIQERHDRLIYLGPDLISIDLANGTAIKVDNPEYETVIDMVADPDGDDIADIFARALGGEATDETKVIAGVSCTVWQASQGDQNASWCMSANGLVLEFVMANFAKRATAVRVGKGGPESDYQVPDGITLDEPGDLTGEGSPYVPVQ